MRDNIFIVDIDKKNYQVARYKQYDNDITYSIKLIENGQEINLLGCTVKAFFSRDDKQIFQKDCIVSNSVVSTKLDNNILALAGDVKIEFKIYKDTIIVTTFTIRISVEESINTNQAIIKQPEWDIVQEVLKINSGQIQKYLDKVGSEINNRFNELTSKQQQDSEVIEARKGKRSLREKIDDIDSQIMNMVNLEVNVKLLGAKGDGVNDDTQFFLDAINLLQNGGILKIPFANYLISEKIIIPSNVIIEGCGSTINLKQGILSSVLATNKSILNKNITINNLKINGNYGNEFTPNLQQSHHALYMYNVEGLTLKNVFVKNPVAWCCSIERCKNVNINDYGASSYGAQTDGIHFIDSINVNGNNFNISSGDDCVGITVDNIDEVYNINISNVNASAPKTGAGSAIRINQSNRSVLAKETKTIRDISIINIIGLNIENRGVTIYDVCSTSTIKNILIDGKFINCGREGLRAVKVDNLNLKATFENCGNYSDNEKLNTITLETAANCNLDVVIRDVADGMNGILINNGTKNYIKSKINYVNIGKSNLQMCIKFERCTKNIIQDSNLDGGLRGIQLGTTLSSSTNNIICNNLIENTVGDSINEGSLSNSNVIINNTVDRSISKSDVRTTVVNNDGYNIKIIESNIAPIAGTWKQGDICINNKPTEIGEVSSKYIVEKWICIAGGEPGTWKECRVLTGN